MPRIKAVVGIDQSLTAFAMTLYVPFGDYYDSVLFKPKTKGVQRLVELKLKIFGQICEWGKTYNIVHVCMEGYSMMSDFGREKAGECGAATKMALASCFGLSEKVGYPTIVAPQQLKKFATGRTNVKKNEVLLAVYKKWDVEFRDDNEADSYVLARVAAAAEGLSGTLLAYEQEVITKLTPHTEYDKWQTPKASPMKKKDLATVSTKASSSSVSPPRPMRRLLRRPSPVPSTTANLSSSGR